MNNDTGYIVATHGNIQIDQIAMRKSMSTPILCALRTEQAQARLVDHMALWCVFSSARPKPRS